MKTIEEVITEFRKILPRIEAECPDRIFQLKNSLRILEWKLDGQKSQGLTFDHMIEPANNLLNEYKEKLGISEKQLNLFE